MHLIRLSPLSIVNWPQNQQTIQNILFENFQVVIAIFCQMSINNQSKSDIYQLDYSSRNIM